MKFVRCLLDIPNFHQGSCFAFSINSGKCWHSTPLWSTATRWSPTVSGEQENLFMINGKNGNVNIDLVVVQQHNVFFLQVVQTFLEENTQCPNYQGQRYTYNTFSKPGIQTRRNMSQPGRF